MLTLNAFCKDRIEAYLTLFHLFQLLAGYRAHIAIASLFASGAFDDRRVQSGLPVPEEMIA